MANQPNTQQLVERLKDGDAHTRLRAAALLGELGPAASPAVPALVECLHDESHHVRKMAALVLGDIGPAAAGAVPALVAALSDGHAGVRRRVVVALGEIASETAVSALEAVSNHEKDEDVRRAAATALRAMGSAAARHAA